MDNVCHTLVGAALAEAGLKKRTALGTVTLLIGANIPDADALAYFADPVTALGFRRGWTHGVPSVWLWPVALAGAMVAWDRLVRRRRHPERRPVEARGVLLLAFLAVLTHPLLDFCNTYGMRWLSPVSDRWSYGDTLFIVDPWIWLALGVAVYLARRRARRGMPDPERPARVALGAVAAYVALMAISNVAARAVVRRAWADEAVQPTRFMAAPAFATPFRRDVVAEVGERYAVGRIDWLRRPAYTLRYYDVRKGARLRAVAEAAATPRGRAFLRWARFPVFTLEQREGEPVVRISDARYVGGEWAQVAIPVKAPLSLASPSSSEGEP